MRMQCSKAVVAISLTIVLMAATGCSPAKKSEPLFNATDVTNALDFVNNRPVPPHAYRVLFVGDSLTVHEPSRGLWDHFKGMAATTPGNDFVHLATSHIQERLASRPVEAFYDNGGKGKIGQMLEYAQTRPNLRPDLVILQGGENDLFDATFQQTYHSLLQAFDATKPRVIVLGDWNSKQKSAFEEEVASTSGIPFVSLLDVHANAANTGDGGPYQVHGVAMHPNDAGMRAIADAINLQFDKLVPSPDKLQPQPKH